jgi:hypothetical protein
MVTATLRSLAKAGPSTASPTFSPPCPSDPSAQAKPLAKFGTCLETLL